MTPAVIDASIGVKWFIEEEDCESADRVLDDIWRGEREFAVPELFFFEVFSVCMRLHPAPEEFARQDMPFLLSLPLTRVQMTGPLAARAAELSVRGLSGYDATYAALALDRIPRPLVAQHLGQSGVLSQTVEIFRTVAAQRIQRQEALHAGASSKPRSRCFKGRCRCPWPGTSNARRVRSRIQTATRPPRASISGSSAGPSKLTLPFCPHRLN